MTALISSDKQGCLFRWMMKVKSKEKVILKNASATLF